jgi:hypothetical protein
MLKNGFTKSRALYEGEERRRYDGEKGQRSHQGQKQDFEFF